LPSSSIRTTSPASQVESLHLASHSTVSGVLPLNGCKLLVLTMIGASVVIWKFTNGTW
jgi:hypothetical protein